VITRDKYFDQLVHMVTKELHDRVTGMQRGVVNSIAQSAMVGVQNKAPSQDPELGNYSDDFELVMLSDKKQISYGFVYKGKMISSSEQDVDTTVLDVRPVVKKIGRWSLVFSIMGEYGPFTLNTWPLKIPKDKAHIIFRSVSKAEAKEIESRNLREVNELRLALATTGIRVSLSEFGSVRNKLDIKKNMAFTVMRKELGIGVKATPHWRPGIRQGRSSGAISKAIQNSDVVRSMMDMRYQGWKELGMISETVSKADLSDLAEFQSEIIKGV